MRQLLTFILFQQIFSKKPDYNSKETPCDHCKKFTKNFSKKLEENKKGNFGGGNSAWEEKSLKGWKTSETRLLEALENVCDNHFGCNSLLEEHEETIETWFFENQDVDIFKYLCVDELKSCCSDGHTFGKDCKKCPGYSKIDDNTKVCNDHGECLGAGDRSGKGKCRCKKGYEGKSCQKCSKGYFKTNIEDGTFQCNKCEKKCSECEGTADNCLKCGGGFREKDRGDFLGLKRLWRKLTTNRKLAKKSGVKYLEN